MSNINPIDDRFIQRIKELEDRASKLSQQTQPYRVDWLGLSVDDITLDASEDMITFTNETPGNFLNIGDRIRLSQTSASPSSYDYLNVTEIDGQDVTIKGDSLSGDTLLYIDYSKNPSPSGFPTSFSYTPTLTGSDFTITDSGSVTANYYILGSICYIEVERTGQEWTGGGVNAYMTDSLPINRENTYKSGIAGIFTGTVTINSTDTYVTEALFYLDALGTGVRIEDNGDPADVTESWGDSASDDDIEWAYRAAYLID